MPEQPYPVKTRLQSEPRASFQASRPGTARYAELHVKSNFSFLRGASHPEELVSRASELGYHALGLTDEATLAGIVRAHVAAKAVSLKLLVGAELRLESEGGPRILLYARDRRGYGNLSRLLTLGRRRVERAHEKASSYHLAFEDVAGHARGLLAVVVPGAEPSQAERTLARAREVFARDVSLALELQRAPGESGRVAAIAALARRLEVPLVATNDVHAHVPERRRLQSVLACIREGVTLERAGHVLFANGERHLRSRIEIEALYGSFPEALARTVEVADAATFTLDELRYEYPDELVPAGVSPAAHLRALTEEGLRERFPGGASPGVRQQVEHELSLVAELGYEPYFLTVHDIVRFARSRQILCQGRGSAANSAVCYALGITSVDPSRIEVLFERFVSRARREPPDIDVDFEHERREEVLQYVYERYGRDRAGLTAEVITYRGRSAVRDVGKVLGLSLDQVDRLAKTLDWHASELGTEDAGAARLREAGLDPADERSRQLVALTKEIEGFPRHLSQHVGGMVIARGLLSELVPIQNAAMPDRTFIEWDKDDLDALGLLKVDCLALGMLTCIRKTFDLAAAHERAGDRLTLASIPAEDPAVYDMLGRADAVGVFQVESRAQMNMLPRLAPRCFYDLVIEVSIVRPGPIHGGVVHPYLRRRRGEDPVVSICPAADKVLAKTLGVPIFQEQAMRLAIEAAGFSADEADALRKAMGAWRKAGTIQSFRERFVRGVQQHGGTTEAVAQELFERIQGFGEYGFPESHAASFSLLVYASAWLKRYHPASFMAGLLNAQPMGFYQPAQIVRDAREHGVEVRPVCVQASGWDVSLEGDGLPIAERPGQARAAPPGDWGRGGPAVRLGLRLVSGLRRSVARAIEAARRDGPFRSLDELAARASLGRESLERLARADALASLGLGRREAVFEALGRRGADPPLFRGELGSDRRDLAPLGSDRRDLAPEPVALPRLSPIEGVALDYETVGLTLGRHPVALVREALDALGARPVAALRDARPGERLTTAGLVICRQRPQTASGIVFFTLEDETGVANLIVRPPVFERFRKAARGGRFLLAAGRLEREGEILHVMVQRLEDVGHLFADLRVRSRDFQ